MLRDSIERFGILTSLTVRSSERYADDFEILAGMHRYLIAKELDIPELPCIIKEVADSEIMLVQFQENAQRADMPPLEAARFIKEMMISNPGITLPQLSNMLCINEAWINKVLKLEHAMPEVIIALRNEEIPFESAVMLSRLPDDLQHDCLMRAVCTDPTDFRKWFRKYWQSLRTTLYTKRAAKYETNRLRAYYRPQKESMHEHETLKVAAAFCENAKEIAGWKKALAWVLHMDTYSKEQQQNRFQYQQEIRLLTKHERKAARSAYREKQQSIPNPSS